MPMQTATDVTVVIDTMTMLLFSELLLIPEYVGFERDSCNLNHLRKFPSLFPYKINGKIFMLADDVFEKNIRSEATWRASERS